MAAVNPSKPGGKGKKAKTKPRTGTNPVPGYELRHNAENERIHQGQITETDRLSALQRGPNPNPTNQPIMYNPTTGKSIIDKIYNAAKQSNLAKGLPPIKKKTGSWYYDAWEWCWWRCCCW